MRYLILAQNYLPESTSGGPYTSALAEYLQARGHEVLVITGFPMAPQWKIWPGYEGKLVMREVINGIPVLRTYLYVPDQPRKALNRILFDMSFSLSALLGGLFSGRWEGIFVISPPLQLGLTAWLLSLVTGARFFFHIKDLIPDAAIATGMLRENGLAFQVGRLLERFIYRRAHKIGVICDGFVRNLVGKGVPPEKIILLPDYIDLDFMRLMDRNNGFRQQHGIAADDFLLMYSGSIGLKQGLNTFIETAAELRGQKQVKFYLVGEGPYLSELQAYSKTLGVDNLFFLPLQPRDNLPAQLAAADALVVTQMKSVTDIVFPSKLLYYMAAGRPILTAANQESETGRFIRSHQVGVVVPPEDPKALAQAIRFLRENPKESERLGNNARRVVSEMFDRKVVLKKFVEQIEILGKNRP